MNTDDMTARLLDAVVPPMPARLNRPPFERIRARARRRRAAMILTATATGFVLIAGTAFAVTMMPRPSTVVGGGPATAASPTPSSDASGVAVTIVEARLDRLGTGLTLYVNPAGDCSVYGAADARVTEQDAEVRLFVHASPEPIDCSRAMVTTVHLTLTSPLGTRSLRNGVTGATVPVFRDADLPVLPLPWTEVHNDFTQMDGTTWAGSYTRPGGPDLRFLVQPGQLDSAGAERVPLGHREGVILPYGGHSYEVDWTVGDLLYRMSLEPSEGGSVSLNQTQQVIAALTWP